MRKSNACLDFLSRIGYLSSNDLSEFFELTSLPPSLIKSRFYDKDFPPEYHSLENPKNKKPFLKRSEILWKRPDEHFESPPLIFKKFLLGESSRIHQGLFSRSLYLLLAIGFLQLWGHKFIERLFLSEQTNAYGCYGVLLNYNGEWVFVFLDDSFPFMKSKSQLLFSHSEKNELWLMILEKAFAKMYGSYENIQVGNVLDAICDLTGCVYESLNEKAFRNQAEWTKQVIAQFEMKWFVLCSEGDLEKEEAQQACWLKEINKRDSIMVVQKPIVLNAEDITNSENDRIQQEMKFDDFFKKFKHIYVYKLKHLPYFNNIKLDYHSQKQTQFIIRMKVMTRTHITLTASQYNKLQFRNINIEYAYSFVRVMVGRIKYVGLEFKNGTYLQGRNVSIEGVYEPGEYLILVEIDWLQSINRKINLNTISDEPLILAENLQNDFTTFTLAQRNLIVSLIEKNPPEQKFSTFAKHSQPNICRYKMYAMGILYMYYTNRTNDALLSETVKMTTLKNMKICYPFKESKKVSFQLFPQKNFLIMFKFVPTDDFKCAYAHQTSSQIDLLNLNQLDLEMNNSDPLNPSETLFVDQPQCQFQNYLSAKSPTGVFLYYLCQ